MLALEMGHDEFTASNGWLSRWQIRYNVKLAVLCGEAAKCPRQQSMTGQSACRPCLMATVTKIGPA